MDVTVQDDCIIIPSQSSPSPTQDSPLPLDPKFSSKPKPHPKSKILKRKPNVVRKQYEQWVYPNPIYDLETYCKQHVQLSDPRIMGYTLWPKRVHWKEMDILVAGCGSNQAPILAYHNPQAHIVGIDFSHTSLEHGRYLKKKHNLKNLSLHQLPIEEVGCLNQDFDYITSTGVLHHLKDPAVGLKALREVLRVEGAINIMVYGRYGRNGVYAFQDIFKRLKLEQTQEDVEWVKETLKYAPKSHSVHRLCQNIDDTGYNAGLVDLFLHRQDQCFTVDQCIDFAQECGFQFIAWEDPYLYDPRSAIPSSSPLFAKVNALPLRDQWSIMESIHETMAKHSFYAVRDDRPKSSYEMDMDNDLKFLSYYPISQVSQVTPCDIEKEIKATISRFNYPPIALEHPQARLFNSFTGEYTVNECIERANISGEKTELIHYARNFIKDLHNIGFIKLFIQKEKQA